MTSLEILDDIQDLETRKANKSEIPTSLPANGGNADTVDGKHATDFVGAKNITTGIQDVDTLNPKDTWVGKTNPDTKNTPTTYATIFNAGADNNSNFQLAYAFNGTTNLYARGRHDVSGNYTKWERVPTQSEFDSLKASVSSGNGKTTVATDTTKVTIAGSAEQRFSARDGAACQIIGRWIPKYTGFVKFSGSIKGSTSTGCYMSFTTQNISSNQYVNIRPGVLDYSTGTIISSHNTISNPGSLTLASSSKPDTYTTKTEPYFVTAGIPIYFFIWMSGTVSTTLTYKDIYIKYTEVNL